MGFVTFIYALVVLMIVIAVSDGQFLSFLAGNVELSGIAPAEYVAENGEVSMAYAASYYLGPIGFYVIIVGALFSMLSAANATILAGSRVKMALARRDHLPRQFDDIHPEYGTPYKTILLTGGFILTFIMVFTVLFGENPEAAEGSFLFGLHLGLESVTNFANFLLISGLSVVNVALIQSRRQSSELDRGFRVPGVPYVPAIAVIANLVLLVNLGLQNILIGLIAEAIGVVFWFVWKSRETPVEDIERETPATVTERNPSGHDRDYQLVVPIANPDHTEQLMRTAHDIAADNDGEILVLSTVSLPEQTPLPRGQQYTDERREVLNRAMTIADGSGMAAESQDTEPEERVPVSGTIRISHHVDEAILNTIDQYDSDAVLMGWGGWLSRRRNVVLGSIVDTVITEATSDVFVERIEGESIGDAESILLPTAGGPHAELAGEVARAVARTTGARIEALRIVSPDATDEERTEAQETVDEAVGALEEVEGTGTVVESEDIADGILERSADNDITIIGATKDGLLQRFVLGSIPERIGERAESSVILTKRNLGITSRLKRLLSRE